MSKQVISATALVCLAVGVGILYASINSQVPDRTEQAATSTQLAYLQTADRCVQLAVADTPDRRRRGLSGYDSLDDNEGMLFVYDDSGNRGFWMKDMDFAIDIIWLDEDSEVVTIKRKAQPKSYPNTFYPTEPAKNVIEVASGMAETLKINSGDRLQIVGPTSTPPGGCELF
jgi:uncharacterized membrane protein (UPF0127 family)